MGDAIGAACVGAVVGWQLPLVRGASARSILATAVEAGVTAVPIGVVFGVATSAVALATVLAAAIVHAAWLASLASRTASSGGRNGA